MVKKKELTLPTKKRSLSFFVAALCAIAASLAVYLVLPEFIRVSYTDSGLGAVASSTISIKNVPNATHLERPKNLKAIYMSQCVVGTPHLRDSLVRFVEDTELNSVVIDIKDYSGKIAFPTDNKLLSQSANGGCGARDMGKFIETLHKKDIYAIGRITVFQDPLYADLHPEQAVQKTEGGVWRDYKKLAFIDVGAKPFWDYISELGKESYNIGFDELNFDYIRFPSDGPMREAVYTWSEGKSKQLALEEFYQYLTEQLRPTGAVLSADLFGYVTVHYDDLGIGQVLERALPYFDYIYPMVYPSHYNSGFLGIKDVNSDPYKIVYASVMSAVEREVATTTKIASFAHIPIASTTPQLYEKPSYRGKVAPWLQSFDYPVHYTKEMVVDQMRAAHDAGVDSYLFWDAANKYTSLRQVFSN
jgi:hypothetical protein